MEIKIETGIPIPVKIRGLKYPFANLEVGQSFFVPGGVYQNIYGSARHHKPKTFQISKVTENQVSGIRVWRVS